jgi:cytoskeletal protein RodZ
MSSENNTDKQFIEDVERLLAGEAVDTGDVIDEDYKRTLEFTQRLMAMRDEPRPVFRSSLKARLIEKLAETEFRESTSAVRIPWWRRPVWGVVVAVIVTAVSLSIMWRAGVFIPFPAAAPPAPTTPTVPTTPTAPTAPTTPTTPKTPTTPTTPTEPTAPAETTVPAFELVEINAVPLQTAYAEGAEVSVTLTVTNHGPDTISLSPFPPEIDITSPDRGTVWEMSGGGEELSIEAGNTETYYFTWNQQDNTNNAVAGGEYTITFTTYLQKDDRIQPATISTDVVIY